MKPKVHWIAPVLFICGLSAPALAQQTDPPSQGQGGTSSSPSAQREPPVLDPSGSGPLEMISGPTVVLKTTATPLDAEVKPVYLLSPKQLWQKAVFFSQRSLEQRQRFLETGQPMMIDQDGVYFWRDLHSYTKGVMLASFFNNKVDVGLYERRYTSPDTNVTGRPLFDYGAERPGEGNIFSGGRQVFVGVRVDLGKLFGKR